jgi:hypothetical protein
MRAKEVKRVACEALGKHEDAQIISRSLIMKAISYLVLLAGLLLGVQSAWADIETRKGDTFLESGLAGHGSFPSRGGLIDD